MSKLTRTERIKLQQQMMLNNLKKMQNEPQTNFDGIYDTLEKDIKKSKIQESSLQET